MASSAEADPDRPPPFTEDQWPEVAEQLLDETCPPDMGTEEFKAMVDAMADFWCFNSHDLMKLMKRNLILFTDDPTEIRNRYKKFCSLLNEMQQTLLKSPNISFSSEQRRFVQESIENILRSIDNSYHSMIRLKLVALSNDPETMATVGKKSLMDIFTMFDPNDPLEEDQKVIRFYLEKCAQLLLRRRGDKLYRPLFTEDGKYTYYYEPYATIEEFIYDAAYPFVANVKLFCVLTKRQTVISNIVNWLKKCHDNLLPQVKTNRYWWSFKNGVLDIDTMQFYPFVRDEVTGLCASDLDRTQTAVNYFPYEFDMDEMLAQSRIAPNKYDPMLVKTENIDKILSAQGFDLEVKRWIYVLLGRMLYPINFRDNWQVFLFLKGIAGTGKSTLLHLVNCLFRPEEVGTLMSQGRQGFPLHHIWDKLVFFCYDLDEKMNFPKTTWTSMVSGENVSVSKLYKNDVMIKWCVNGGFAGNTNPPWIDHQGEVGRRFVIVEFEHPVRHADPRLYDKCKAELPAFLYKITALYNAMAKEYAEKSIWDVLPQFFHTTKRRLVAGVNPIFSFLENETERKAGARCLFSEFKQKFYKYTDEWKLNSSQITKRKFVAAFKREGLVLVTPGRNHPSGLREPYIQDLQIIGLDLQIDVDEQKQQG